MTAIGGKYGIGDARVNYVSHDHHLLTGNSCQPSVTVVIEESNQILLVIFDSVCCSSSWLCLPLKRFHFLFVIVLEQSKLSSSLWLFRSSSPWKVMFVRTVLFILPFQLRSTKILCHSIVNSVSMSSDSCLPVDKQPFSIQGKHLLYYAYSLVSTVMHSYVWHFCFHFVTFVCLIFHSTVVFDSHGLGW